MVHRRIAYVNNNLIFSLWGTISSWRILHSWNVNQGRSRKTLRSVNFLETTLKAIVRPKTTTRLLRKAGKHRTRLYSGSHDLWVRWQRRLKGKEEADEIAKWNYCELWSHTLAQIRNSQHLNKWEYMSNVVVQIKNSQHLNNEYMSNLYHLLI